jgi:P27 family predicted phage terminase small subunit
MRGRPRKSASTHRLAGSYREDRHGPKDRPAAAAPRCPAWLSREAKKKWRELAPVLSRQGLLTPLDVDAFTVYCSCWAVWRELLGLLQKEGHVYQAGELRKRHPAGPAANEVVRSLLRFGECFGLTPASRERLGVDVAAAEEPADEFEEYLRRHADGGVRARNHYPADGILSRDRNPPPADGPPPGDDQPNGEGMP